MPAWHKPSTKIRLIALALAFFISLPANVRAIPLGNPLKTLSQLQSNAYAQETNSNNNNEDEIVKGTALYREGKWAEAIAVWEKVLEKDPNNTQVKNYIDRAKKKIAAAATATTTATTQPKPEEKEPTATEAAAPGTQQEDPVQTLLKEGVDFYREGKYSEAIQAWNKVLVKDPNNERAKRYIERALKKQAEVTGPAPTAIPVTPPPAPPAKVEPKIEPAPTPPAPVATEKKPEPVEKPAPPAEAPIPERVKQSLAAIKAEAQKAAVPQPPKPKIETAPPKPTLGEPPAPLAVQKPPETRTPTLLPVPSQTGEIKDYGTLDLKECVKLALANYGPSRISREEIKLAKMRLIEARRAAYPSVNLKNGITQGISTDEPFKGLEFTAEFQMPVMTGGRIKNSIRQAEANLAVSIRNYEKVRADYVAEVEQAYYALSNAKKYYRDRQLLLKEGTRAMDITRKQYDQGLARQLDLLNVESQYNEVEYQITSAEKDLQLAFLTLKQLMNLQDNETYDIEELGTYTVVSVDYDSILKLALRRRPDIRLAELQVLFNKYAVKVAESKDRFKVDLNASVGLNDQFFTQSETLDLQTEYFVGFKATKPLGMHTIEDNFIKQNKVPAAGQTTSSDFGSNTVSISLFNNNAKTGITEAKIAYYRAKEDLDKGKKTTRFEVQQNFFEYQKALAQLEGAITKLKLGEEEVKILKAQADLNQAQLIDVLRAQVRQYDAKANYGQAVTSYYTSMANLNKAIGIIGYFNPVTGQVGEEFHRLLAKPINKPKFRFFTQVTKDKPEEDILTFPLENVTAEMLLEKERRHAVAYSNLFYPAGIIPGAALAFDPKERSTHYLSSYYLPPEKPFPPMKPWQVLRLPALGLFEFEQVVDDDPYKAPKRIPANSTKKQPQQKGEKAKAGKKIPALKNQVLPVISSLNLSEDKDFIRVTLGTNGPLEMGAYELKDPFRLLFVLENPAKNPQDLKGANIDNRLVKGIRFNTSQENQIEGIAIDLSKPVQYRVDNGKKQVVILLEKSQE